MKRKRVSAHLVASIVGRLCSPRDNEWRAIASIAPGDKTALRELVRDKVVPEFSEFDEESQRKMRDSLEYFIRVQPERLERILAAYQIPIQPQSAAAFFAGVWEELFGPATTNGEAPENYVVDKSQEFANSIRKKGYPKEG